MALSERGTELKCFFLALLWKTRNLREGLRLEVKKTAAATEMFALITHTN